MAFLLGCEKVGVDFPSKTVFDEISLGVNDGERKASGELVTDVKTVLEKSPISADTPATTSAASKTSKASANEAQATVQELAQDKK